MQELSMQELSKEMFEFFGKVNSAEEFQKIFSDLCTFNEVEQMGQRLQCAKLFLQGLTYAQIIEKTDISSATLSRVSRCIHHGSGGYNEVLKQFMEKEGMLPKSAERNKNEI